VWPSKLRPFLTARTQVKEASPDDTARGRTRPQIQDLPMPDTGHRMIHLGGL